MNRRPLLRLSPLLAGALLAGGCAPALFGAAERGDIPTMRRILDSGVDVNKSYTDLPQAVLHKAASAGQVESVKFLLSRGADPNLQASNFYGGPLGTPLCYAAVRTGRRCDEKTLEIARLLLEAGAKADVPLNDKRSLMEYLQLYQNESECDRKLLTLLKDASLIKEKADERKAGEARTQERASLLQAKQTDILAAEKAGDELKAAGKGAEALAKYAEAARLAPQGTEEGLRLRRKLIAHAFSLPARPVVSQEAETKMLRGMAFMKKAEGPEDLRKAASELEGALALAPWWPDAYFNLGLLQEKLGEFKDAIANLELYRLAAPDAPDADAVRRKLVELQVSEEMRQSKSQ